MKPYFPILELLLYAFCVVSPGSFQNPPLKEFKISGFAQGTTFHITYYATDSIVSRPEVDSILSKIDSSLSLYKSYSLINKFNNARTGIEIDDHFRTVVTRSLEIYKITNGVSDITIYPLMKVWGFGAQPSLEKPDSAGIRSLMPCIGAEKIHISRNRLLKNTPCVQIDVNGIAQGYSVDIIAQFLDKNRIINYIVEIGGEVRVRGRKQPGNRLMKIGMESPAENSFDEPVLKKIIQLQEGAVTTSGNYRKYIEREGKKIVHLMNPKTGYPFQNELISVTVYAKDAITADGYDNALMGMGLKKALSFLKKHKEMEAYFIYRNSEGIVADTATTGFYKLIQH